MSLSEVILSAEELDEGLRRCSEGVSPRREMRVSPWRKRAYTALKIGAMFLFGGIALSVLVTWIWAMVFGIAHGIVGWYRSQYDAVYKLVLHSFVPEPEPEPGYFEKLSEQAVALLKRVDTYQLALLVVAIAIFVSLWMISGAFFYGLRRAIMNVRGIQFEAMRPGSTFMVGEKPKCQVEILIPGILMDTHQGYGIRVQNWLVLPRHVLAGGDLVLAGPKGKLLVTPQVEESAIHPDVAYLWLEQKQWVTLGVSNASCTPSLSGYARCYGPKGYSTGTVNKTRMQGVLKYSGSTVAGMSGAAYVMADKVIGMHTGASGDLNLGVAAALFVSELKYKVTHEAFLPSSNNAEDAAFMKTKDTWDAKMLDRIAKDAALNTDTKGWSEDVDFDYDQRLDFEASGSKARETIKLATIMMENQGVDSGLQEYELVNNDLRTQVRDLRERVEMLERYVQAQIKTRPLDFPCDQCEVKTTSAQNLEQHKKKHVKFPCEFCDVQTTSSEKLANHVAKSHPPKTVVGESAYPGDARVVVETKPFLEKRPTTNSNSRRRRKRSSSENSSTKDRAQVSQPWAKSLNQMAESQLRIEKLFLSVLAGTAGQSSGTRQS